MKEKCEWNDGEFYPCEDLCYPIKRSSELVFSHKSGRISMNLEEITEQEYFFCPFCGADIRKPEPKVIIKKSGETFVARYNGVDYLWTKRSIPWDSDETPLLFGTTTGNILAGWKPISEIEITDKIAKLRPMVVWGPNGKSMGVLCRVRQDGGLVFEYCNGYIRDGRLATVDNLP